MNDTVTKVDEDGRIVADDFEGKWCGVTVCEECFRKARRGEVTEI